MSLEAVTQFNAGSLLDTVVSLVSAFVLGSAIGLERQLRQRTAGLRTNALVAVGAAVFVDMANRLGGHDAAVHVVAYVVSGIGFLGAGAIMKEGASVSGLNTAATLWGSAAVGACAGADLIAEALVAALFVLSSNTLLRPVVNRINRRPVNEEAAEATYKVHVVTSMEAQVKVREKMVELLEEGQYPAREVEQHAFGQHEAEIRATLYATAVDSSELDQVVTRLESLSGVTKAFWEAGVRFGRVKHGELPPLPARAGLRLGAGSSTPEFYDLRWAAVQPTDRRRHA